ncbi:oxalate oxidase 1-like [Typha latifolia]|uniref:oxalate oxidase 1-like n=1 Tax=Typha latifolia TaxID=4733 RepID=UPI003C2B1340
MEISSLSKLLLFLSAALLLSSLASAADPDPVDDLCIADLTKGKTINGYPCKPEWAVCSDDFFSSILSTGGDTDNPNGSNATSGDVTAFPGINTLGVSMNRVDFAPGGVNPPHVHPRASEIGLVVRGKLLLGIMSTKNVLYSKVLKAGENFVIPRGLMHFQYNVGEGKATQIVAFNSQSPGIVFAPETLFGSMPEIPTKVLTKAFRVDEEIVDLIKSEFGNCDACFS